MSGGKKKLKNDAAARVTAGDAAFVREAGVGYFEIALKLAPGGAGVPGGARVH